MRENRQEEGQAVSERRKCPHCGREVSVDMLMCPSCHFFLNWADTLPNRWCMGVQVSYSRNMLVILLCLAVTGKLLLLLGTPSVDEVLQMRSAGGAVLGHLFRAVGECGLLYGLGYGLRFERKHMSRHILMLTAALAALCCFSILWTIRAALPIPGAYSYAMFLAGMGLLVSMQVLYLLLGIRLCCCYHGNLNLLGSTMIVIVIAQVVLNFGLRLLGTNIVWDTLMFGAYVFYLFMLYSLLYDQQSYLKKMNDVII